jgi:hypothetical protein
MLWFPLHQRTNLFLQKILSRIAFSEIQSLFFHLLSFFVIQCFFLLNFDILPYEEQALCCSDFEAFFFILIFSTVENLESIHCFLFSYQTKWEL